MPSKRRLYVVAIIAACIAWSRVNGQTQSRRPESALGQAQPVVATIEAVHLSLSDAIFLSLVENDAVRSAYITRVAERFDLRVAEDKFTPQPGINVDINWRRQDAVVSRLWSISPEINTRLPTGAQFRFVWEREGGLTGGANAAARSVVRFEVQQPLLRGGGLDVNMASIRIGRLDENINKLRLRDTVEATVSQVVFGYRTLQQAQRRVALEVEALERARTLLQVNRAMVAAGRMAAMEITQTQASMATQEVSLFEARNTQDRARLALIDLLALEPRTNLIAQAVEDITPSSIDTDKLVALALDDRTDVLVQRATVDRIKQELLLAQNEQLWDISVVGDVTRGMERPVNGVSSSVGNAGIGLKLRIPLRDLPRKQALVRAQANMQVAAVDTQRVLRRAEIDVRDAARQLELRWQQVVASKHARDLTAQSLEIEQQKLRVGRSSNFQVLSFESDLRLAQARELNAIIDYLNAQTSLDRQVGTTLRTWKIELND